MASDFRHLFGSHAGHHHVVGSAPMLERIYRPSRAVRRRGYRAVRRAACTAYAKTTNAFATKRELRELFHKIFIRRYGDWDVVIGRFIRRRGSVEGWRQWTTRYLRHKRYRKSLIAEYVNFIPRSGYVWRRAAFLYDRKGLR